MQAKTVYCIIVTYNGMQWIEKCLDSLLHSTHPNYCIVVDNGSTDGTVAFIKKRFPCTTLIESGKNLGFGQGNNIGLTMAFAEQADYIFLLNQDAWVQKDTITKLVAAAEEAGHFGIISPVHLNGKGDDFDPYFYDYLIKSDIRPCMQAVFFEINSAALIRTPFVNAAAWLISRECLEKTGGFDPIFFHYGEDDNYAHRVHYKGFDMGILRDAFICHDKDYSQGLLKNIRQQFRHDWIIFLHQACNILRPGCSKLIIKRLCRYGFMTITSCLKFSRPGVYYNFSMVKNILLSIPGIKRSRNACMYNETPYLFSSQQRP